MNVNLEKTFPISAPASVAWQLLSDIEKVAGCMPGAKITESSGENQFKGTVAVKFGPANMSFRGEVEVKATDAVTRTIQLTGTGTDSTGSSGASMDLTASIVEVDTENCQLIGKSEVSVSGKAAAFGGRMMGAVADQVLKQFGGNFEKNAVDLAQSTRNGAIEPSPEISALPNAEIKPPQKEPQQLNAISLLVGMVKDWLVSIFGTKK